MFYPLTLQPILKERVWGGQRLAALYGKPVPPHARVGESWEITDRPEGVSVVAEGPLAGQNLHQLLNEHPREILGGAAASGGRFPLLVKLLDAREKLSLQVHPPAALAAALGGEPKTEMWYVAEADPGASIYVGLRRGVTRGEFSQRISDGTVADCFHRVPIQAGDTMFLPSGRVHAIGGGCVIFEIQQNSDTTYRVFDWNRVGLDGQPRELHVEASLRCIDFADFEPDLVRATPASVGDCVVTRLADDPLFQVEHWRGAAAVLPCAERCLIIGALAPMRVGGGGREVSLAAGGFALIPACLEQVEVRAGSRADFLVARPG